MGATVVQPIDPDEAPDSTSAPPTSTASPDATRAVTAADDERYGDDLAAQYSLARTEYPDADTHRLIEVIVSRLSQDALRYYTADPDRMLTIAAFVHDMESDPGEDDDETDIEP